MRNTNKFHRSQKRPTNDKSMRNLFLLNQCRDNQLPALPNDKQFNDNNNKNNNNSYNNNNNTNDNNPTSKSIKMMQWNRISGKST